jgi:hypothetical protein
MRSHTSASRLGTFAPALIGLFEGRQFGHGIEPGDVQLIAPGRARRATIVIANDANPPFALGLGFAVFRHETMQYPASLRLADLHGLGNQFNGWVEAVSIVIAPIGQRQHGEPSAARERAPLHDLRHDIDAHDAAPASRSAMTTS